LWIRKAQQTIFVNGIGGALARGAADLVIFPFTLIKARLEVGLDFVRIEKKGKLISRVLDIQQ
jgi:hypothetical protein